MSDKVSEFTTLCFEVVRQRAARKRYGEAIRRRALRPWIGRRAIYYVPPSPEIVSCPPPDTGNGLFIGDCADFWRRAGYHLPAKETPLPIMFEKLYDALRAAGIPDEKARAAAVEVAEFKEAIREIRGRLRLHTWILSAASAGILAIIGLILRGH